MDFRQYDPAIARFNGIDPVTHFSQGTSVAFDNNPIYWADPSGANSTAEWMEENGITDDDLITIYQAPNDDGTEQNESESNEECCGGYVAAYKHEESPKERRYYNNNRGYRKLIREAAYDAGILETRVSGKLGGDDLGYSGAIRHSYWMYLVAINLSPEIAETVGFLHEDFTVDVGENKGKNNLLTRDSKMDMANNIWGINLARENPNLSPLEFEELFLRDVTSQNTTIIIFDEKTIPKESLKTGIESRKQVREKWKSHESQRINGFKF